MLLNFSTKEGGIWLNLFFLKRIDVYNPKLSFLKIPFISLTPVFFAFSSSFFQLTVYSFLFED